MVQCKFQRWAPVTSCAQIDTHTCTHSPAAREVVIVRTYPGEETGMKNGGRGPRVGCVLLKAQPLEGGECLSPAEDTAALRLGRRTHRWALRVSPHPHCRRGGWAARSHHLVADWKRELLAAGGGPSSGQQRCSWSRGSVCQPEWGMGAGARTAGAKAGKPRGAGLVTVRCHLFWLVLGALRVNAQWESRTEEGE